MNQHHDCDLNHPTENRRNGWQPVYDARHTTHDKNLPVAISVSISISGGGIVVVVVSCVVIVVVVSCVVVVVVVDRSTAEIYVAIDGAMAPITAAIAVAIELATSASFAAFAASTAFGAFATFARTIVCRTILILGTVFTTFVVRHPISTLVVPTATATSATATFATGTASFAFSFAEMGALKNRSASCESWVLPRHANACWERSLKSWELASSHRTARCPCGFASRNPSTK
jgi:hypothetical protein